RITEVVRVELQQRVVVVVGDGKHRLEHRLEPDLLPAVRGNVLLQKRLVRALLHLDEVRNLDDRRDLAEVFTAAAPALDSACHTLSRGRFPALSSTPWLNQRAVDHPRLLHLYRRALLVELLLHLLRLGLGDLLLHRLRGTVDKVLRFLEPEPGQLADDLDDLDLLLASGREDDVELRLLLRCGRAHRRGPRGARSGGHRHRRRGRHAPHLLEQLGELGGLEQRQLVELLGDLLNRGHRSLLLLEIVRRRHSAAFLPRCCRTDTSSRCGAVSTTTSCARIPWIVPTSRARSCSRDGRSASALSCAGGSIWPSTYPALIASAWFAFANVWSALATATGSSFEKTTPVGPVRCGPSASSPDDLIASRASRFLTTL